MKELRERLALALDEFLQSAIAHNKANGESFPTVEAWLDKWSAALLGGVPIPMLLYCPKCNTQHVDFPEPLKGWENPPHRTHYCKAIIDGVACAHNWRPSDYYTTGVEKTDSRGMADGFTQPGGIRTTVLQPAEVIPVSSGSGWKHTAGSLALNVGARLLLGKTKAGRWTVENFGSDLANFKRER